MKRLIIILLLILVSCNTNEERPISEGPIELSKETENYYRRVVEYEYEGCEYIKVGFGKSIWGSHKGNCSNPIHKGMHPNVYQLDIDEK